MPTYGFAAAVLDFDGSSELDSNVNSVQVLADAKAEYSFEQARALLSEPPASVGQQSDCIGSCWLKVLIRNTSGKPIDIGIHIDGNDRDDVWVVKADQTTQQIGSSSPSELSKQSHQLAPPTFTAGTDEVVALYARVFRVSVFRTLTVPEIEMVPFISGLENSRPDVLFRGVLIGALLGLALYNLVIAISTRDTSYRWYCTYLAMMMLSFICTSGPFISGQLLSSAYPLIVLVAGNLADMLMWLCLIMFTRVFLSTSKRLGAWDWVFFPPAFLLIVSFVLGLCNFNGWLDMAYFGFVTASPAGVIASAIVLRKGFKPAKYVLAGQLVLCVGAAVQTAFDYNWITFTAPPGHAVLQLLLSEPLWCLTVIEAVIFSLALADRMRGLQAEMSVQMIQNLRDRETLINQQRVELELEVAARTSDLVEEKIRSDRLLQNILPDEIADELKLHGSTRPKRYDHTSVLFTDFRGFTTVVSSLPADRVVQELNDIFRSFDDILDQVGVEKIKTIGDSYMIVAGLPVEAEDHAIRCAEAALQMLEFIEERNRSASIKWEMRAGIHSGSVVAGIVGKRKFAYDIFGDTVNIASRLESAGAPGRLNVSAYTYDLIRHRFQGEYRGKVDAKGKGAIDMYFIDRIDQQQGGTTAIQG